MNALPALPVGDAANERQVRAGFFRKLARVAARIPFAADAVALYYVALDPQTPRRTKALIFAGLAYFILPTDAIPDVFAGIGFTDDTAVIAAVVALAGGAIRKAHRDKAKALLAKARSGL